MQPRRVAALFVPAALICAGTFAWRILATRAFFEPRALLSRFPAEDGTVLSADFSLLRRSGLLTSSGTPLEADYRRFLEGTGFDYRRDLDTLVASFSRTGNYFIARGRFDWPKLRQFAVTAGGSCYQQLCRVQGSTPERRISFLPLRRDTIALAVSTNDLAATRLATESNPVTAPLPSAPVWVSVPGAQLRTPAVLPGALYLMLSALATTDRVLLTLESSEVRLETTCKTSADARILASQLRTVTATLREALSQDSGDELARTLTQGQFDQTDTKVSGRWPAQKGLIESLTAGL